MVQKRLNIYVSSGAYMKLLLVVLSLIFETQIQIFKEDLRVILRSIK